MRLFTSLILIVFAIASIGEAGVSSLFMDRTQADAMFVQASLYEQDGNLEEASKLLEAVLENVEDEYIFLKLANIYDQLKDNEMLKFTLERGVRKLPDSYLLTGALADFYRSDPDTAKQSFELYRKALKLSGNPVYAEREAIAHAVLKDYNGAIKIYGQLIEKNQLSEYYVQRARLYEKLGLENESIQDYIKAADIDGNFVAAAKLSDHFVKIGDNAKAIVYLRMLVESSPELTIAKFRLAELLRKVGKSEEAVEFYRSILDSLNVNEKEYVLKQLAAIAFDNKDYNQAEEYFTQAYQINDDIQTIFSLALLAEASGNLSTAKDWYKKVLVKRPDFTEANKRLAILYIKSKDYDSALETLSAVADTDKDVDFFRIEGQAYTDKGDLAKAIEVLSKAVKDNPAEVKLYIDLAIAVEKNGDKIKAENVVKDGLKYFPDDASLLNFLGYMYAEQGKNLEEATKLIKRALEKKPDEAAYLDSMAWVLFQQGRYEEALPWQKRALRGASSEKEIQDHMKAILDKLGIRKTLDEIIKED